MLGSLLSITTRNSLMEQVATGGCGELSCTMPWTLATPANRSLWHDPRTRLKEGNQLQRVDAASGLCKLTFSVGFYGVGSSLHLHTAKNRRHIYGRDGQRSWSWSVPVKEFLVAEPVLLLTVFLPLCSSVWWVSISLSHFHICHPSHLPLL